MKIFITGRPGSGKSTVLMKIVERMKAEGVKIGGITTPEVRIKGDRVAFRVIDLSSGEEGVLASVNQPTGPRVSKYRVNLPDFERVAIPALDFALNECDVIFVDELGRMEFYSTKFKLKINEVLSSRKIVVATIQLNYVDIYEKHGVLFHITPGKRETIVNKIVSNILHRFKYKK